MDGIPRVICVLLYSDSTDIEASCAKLRRSLDATFGDKSPDEKHNYGADNGTNEPGTLSGLVPSKRTPEITGNDRSDHAKNRRHDETGRFVIAWHDEFRNHARNKPNNDRQHHTHGKLSD